MFSFGPKKGNARDQEDKRKRIEAKISAKFPDLPKHSNGWNRAYFTYSKQ